MEMVFKKNIVTKKWIEKNYFATILAEPTNGGTNG
jgi:hypothetical protein